MARFASRSILTVRPAREGGGFRGTEGERLALIKKLGELNPAYIDVELSTLEKERGLTVEDLGHRVIVSWHDIRRTPEKVRLLSIMSRAASFGGLVKLVPTARSAADNLKVLSLYDEPGPTPIAFCMGGAGILSRVVSMELGSPIVYGSLPGEPIAPGQPSVVQLRAIRRVLQNG